MIGHRRLSTIFIGVITATLVTTAAAGVAGAQEPEPPEPGTVEVGGHEYPADSLTVQTGEVEIVPSSSVEPQLFDADYFFGSSYASTREIAYVNYRGTAKAAANIFQGERIIQVGIWYMRRNNAGVDEVVGARKNSDARYNGGWSAGPEVAVTASDSLGLNDPPTRFRYSVTGAPPGATP